MNPNAIAAANRAAQAASSEYRSFVFDLPERATTAQIEEAHRLEVRAIQAREHATAAIEDAAAGSRSAANIAALGDIGGTAPAVDTAEELRSLDEFVRAAKVGDAHEFRSILNIAGGTSTGAATVPTTPGPLVRPTVFDANLMDLITVLNTASGEKMPVPRIATRQAFAAVAETGTIPESNPSLTSVVLDPQKFAAISGASVEMIQDSALNVAAEIIVPGFEESAKLTGDDEILNGTNTTGGLLAVAPGVTTAATGAITADEWIAAYYALKPAARRNAVWVMASGTIEATRKLKDSEGAYLLTGLSDGEPRLLGKPVVECPAAPEMDAGETFAVFGDLRQAVYGRMVQGLTVERSDQWKWDADVVSFKARFRWDNAVVDESACVTVANAA